MISSAAAPGLGGEREEREGALVDSCASEGGQDARRALHPPPIPARTADPRPLLALFLASSLWTLLLTALPVLAGDALGDYGSPAPGYFGGADVARLLEPLVSLPLSLAVLARAGAFEPGRALAAAAWAVFTAIGVQGAALHSAAVMIKHPVEGLQASGACVGAGGGGGGGGGGDALAPLFRWLEEDRVGYFAYLYFDT